MNDSPITIERLSELNEMQISSLLARAEAEGHRMLRRFVTSWNLGVNRFDQSGEAFWVARDADGDEDLAIGVCGLNVDPYENDPTIGRVRHLYVIREHRRQGIARRLLETLIDHARGRFNTLQLRTPGTQESDAFYESLGFNRVHDHPTCTHRMTL